MIHVTYHLQLSGSMPDAKFVTYLQEPSDEMGIRKRPFILVCPGGGYAYTSDREAESLALQFLAMGCHAGVLRYSCAPARYPAALLELASAVLLVRGNAEEWRVDEEKIVVQGCSAGGHLAASYGMFWNEDFISAAIGLEGPDHEILRPNGMILCYPVITSGEFAHRDSFAHLLGSREEELKDKMSLEKQVSAGTPQTFLWHTFEDQCVPAENSLLLVAALRKAGIPVEFHLYPKGGHGLSLANRLTATPEGYAIQEECQTWLGLAKTWLEKNIW
ncbi:MAG: alpha/beta hydrolase [Clostridium sp.]|jgi:acetyl esterase/lipase|nr:alpha/beta hydrolase [Clostridium sp.]